MALPRKPMEMHGATVGRTAGEHWPVEYAAWRSMLQRCYDRNSRSYATHGARGIRVCPRWRRSYAAFFADLGHRPSKRHQLDRIRNDRNYTPGNCRWATPAMQARNRRTSKLSWGDVVSIRHWLDRGVSGASLARAYGVSDVLISRIKLRKVWKESE